MAKTNNTRYSPVVTDLSTSLALHSLIRGERTGSHVFCELWSFVLKDKFKNIYTPNIWKPLCKCY